MDIHKKFENLQAKYDLLSKEFEELNKKLGYVSNKLIKRYLYLNKIK